MTITEHANDYIQVKITPADFCILNCEVKILPPLKALAEKAALKNAVKKVAIPGFRVGHAPAAAVAKKHPGVIKEETVRALGPLVIKHFEELCSPQKLTSQTQYENLNISKDLSTFSFQYETEPAIPEIDPSTIELHHVERPVVNEEKVNETIRQTQMFFTEWKTVEGRAVEAHDFVVIDLFAINEDGTENLVFSNTRFELTDKAMSKWMKDLLIGKKPGETIFGMSTPDEDMPENKKKEFLPKKVRVHIDRIESTELPALDDAFATRVGVTTVAELKKRVEELLNKKADDHVKEHYADQLTMKLLEMFSFPLPQSLLNQEVRFRFTQLINDAEYKNYWEGLSKADQENTVKQLISQSEKAIRLFYLSQKIISSNNLSLSKDNVEKAPGTFLEMLVHPQHDVTAMQQTETSQAESYSRALMDKAFEHLLKGAKIVNKA